MNQSIDQSISN